MSSDVTIRNGEIIRKGDMPPVAHPPKVNQFNGRAVNHIGDIRAGDNVRFSSAVSSDNESKVGNLKLPSNVAISMVDGKLVENAQKLAPVAQKNLPIPKQVEAKFARPEEEVLVVLKESKVMEPQILDQSVRASLQLIFNFEGSSKFRMKLKNPNPYNLGNGGGSTTDETARYRIKSDLGSFIFSTSESGTYDFRVNPESLKCEVSRIAPGSEKSEIYKIFEFFK